MLTTSPQVLMRAASAAMVVYAVAAAAVVMLLRPGYGLIAPLLTGAGLCSIASIVMWRASRPPSATRRWVRVGAYLGLLPGVLWGAFVLVMQAPMAVRMIVTDALGCHAMLMIFGATLGLSLVLVFSAVVVVGMDAGYRWWRALD